MAAEPELPELRLTPSVCPKARHGPEDVKMPALVRSAPASPNSLVPSVSPGGFAAGPAVSRTEPNVFTLASANPDADRLVAVPQQGGESLPISHVDVAEVTQRLNVRLGLLVLLPSKS